MGIPTMPSSGSGSWDAPAADVRSVGVVRTLVLLPIILVVAPCYVLESLKGILVYAMRPIGFQGWR